MRREKKPRWMHACIPFAREERRPPSRCVCVCFPSFYFAWEGVSLLALFLVIVTSVEHLEVCHLCSLCVYVTSVFHGTCMFAVCAHARLPSSLFFLVEQCRWLALFFLLLANATPEISCSWCCGSDGVPHWRFDGGCTRRVSNSCPRFLGECRVCYMLRVLCVSFAVARHRQMPMVCVEALSQDLSRDLTIFLPPVMEVLSLSLSTAAKMNHPPPTACIKCAFFSRRASFFCVFLSFCFGHRPR